MTSIIEKAGSRTKPARVAARFRRGLLAAAVVPLLLAAGCEEKISPYFSGGSGGGSSRSLRSGNTVLGYGRVSYWAADLGLLKAELRACHEAGIGIYTASLLGWWGTAMPGATEQQIRNQTEAAYKVLIDECRSLGMIALIDIHNQNSGSGKYGEQGRALSDPAEVDLIDWGIELVRKHGPAGVVVVPCRETSDASGLDVERKCVERLDGFQLCANTGARTWPAPGWADFAEWHPWAIAEAPPAGAIVVSDTGPILSQLNVGGAFGPGQPEIVRQWMMAGVAQGNPARVYYTLYPGPLDLATIQAIGSAAP
mgnify:CR=1 FL=1